MAHNHSETQKPRSYLRLRSRIELFQIPILKDLSLPDVSKGLPSDPIHKAFPTGQSCLSAALYPELFVKENNHQQLSDNV